MTTITDERASVVLHVGGMQFASEKAVVERVLGARPGVLGVEANPVAQTATVSFDPEVTSITELQRWVEECGYHCAGRSVPGHVCDPLAQVEPLAAHDHAAVERAVERLGLRHPVLDDPDLATWHQYGVKGWPTLVVVDPEGYVVGGVSGEGSGPVVFSAVERAAAEHDANTGTAIQADGASETSATLRALYILDSDDPDAVVQLAEQLPATLQGATVEIWPLTEPSTPR